jgi:hypothetical protein
MFTDQRYYELFEEIASQNKALAHSSTDRRFFKTPDEVPERNFPDAFHLILLPPQYEFLDHDSDNLIERFRGSFLIVRPVQRENYISQLDTVTQAREIARQILSRLKKYRLDGEFHEFTIGNAKGEPVGPIMENCHGVAFDFVIGDPAGIVFDPSKWFE